MNETRLDTADPAAPQAGAAGTPGARLVTALRRTRQGRACGSAPCTAAMRCALTP